MVIGSSISNYHGAALELDAAAAWTVTSFQGWPRCTSPLLLAPCRRTGHGWPRPRFRRTPSSEPAAEASSHASGSPRPCKCDPWPWIHIREDIRLGYWNGAALVSGRSLRTCASCRLSNFLVGVRQPGSPAMLALRPSRRGAAGPERGAGAEGGGCYLASADFSPL